MMSVFSSIMALIFFSCLGQLVDTLRELQFCILRVKEQSKVARKLFLAPAT
jgi:hypothetical protein